MIEISFFNTIISVNTINSFKITLDNYRNEKGCQYHLCALFTIQKAECLMFSPHHVVILLRKMYVVMKYL